MKKIISIFLCVLMAFSCLSICASAETSAPTYYVDSVGGNDANTGNSEDSAWKTINHDNWVFVPGTKVFSNVAEFMKWK